MPEQNTAVGVYDTHARAESAGMTEPARSGRIETA